MGSARHVVIVATWLRAIGCAVGAAPPFWPQPRKHTSGDDRPFVTSGWQFHLEVHAKEPAAGLARAAFARVLPRLFPHGVGACVTGEVVAGLRVQIDDPDAPLRLGVDESYTLDIPNGGWASLQAETVFGAYHGLETLSQLVSFDFTSGTYEVKGAPWHVEDAPRFPHRGLLIDTARHFQPVPALNALIDAMAMSKLNVLHWHMTDDQSWPIASRAHPEFPEHGAFSEGERYTWGEMVGLVEFARARGVRVVPELDMPGHSTSWSLAHPEIFPTNCTSALDPAKESVYTMVSELLADWADVFTDEVFHLGTDEVPEACWNNTQDLAFMASQGLTTLDDLFGLFVHRAAGIASSQGKRPAVWDESLLRAPPPRNAVVQVWHCCSGDLVQRALDLGNDVIYSPDPWWYLDALADNSSYMYDAGGHAPLELAKTPATGTARVLGGEACMWGETVDPSVLEATVWPRAAAVAEQLWSQASATSGGFDAEAQTRLEAFRCLLLQRGVRAGMATGDGRATPPGPGSCSQRAILF